MSRLFQQNSRAPVDEATKPSNGLDFNFQLSIIGFSLPAAPDGLFCVVTTTAAAAKEMKIEAVVPNSLSD